LPKTEALEFQSLPGLITECVTLQKCPNENPNDAKPNSEQIPTVLQKPDPIQVLHEPNPQNSANPNPSSKPEPPKHPNPDTPRAHLLFPLKPRGSAIPRELGNFIKERIIIFDYSFQSLSNNLRSVQARSPSLSVARLFNLTHPPNAITQAKNTFQDLTQISLTCDLSNAQKITAIHSKINPNLSLNRDPKSWPAQDIPNITKITKEILRYGQNGILRESRGSEKLYRQEIPFYERIMDFYSDLVFDGGYKEGGLG
jgi:hypothetical protein